MSSPKWSGKPKRFNPSRNFVMSDTGAPTRKFNPKSTFSPSHYMPSGPASVSPPSDPASLAGQGAAPGSASPAAAPSSAPWVSGGAVNGGLGGASQGGAVGGSLGGSLGDAGDGLSPGVPGQVPGGGAAPTSEALEYAGLYRPTPPSWKFHLFAPTPFRQRMKPLEPHERSADELTLPRDLRKLLLERNENVLNVSMPYLNVFVHVYHSLTVQPFFTNDKISELLGHRATLYKGISYNDGRVYCLLVCSDFEMSSENEHALQAINKWKRVQSSFVAGVVEAFTTLAFTSSPQASMGPQASRGGVPGTPSSGSVAAASSSTVPSAPSESADGGADSGADSGAASGADSGAAAASSREASEAADPGTPSLRTETASDISTPRTEAAAAAATPSRAVAADQKQSLVVVYEYYPLAQPLASLPNPSEQNLWSVAVQIFSAVAAIHRRRLACRGTLHEDFVLLQGENRVRLGFLGVQDIVDSELGDVQQDDYRLLGEMLQRLSRGVATSAPFADFIAALLERNVERASQLLVPQLYHTLDQAFGQQDTLEDHLAHELENGRLVRLMAKLDFVLNTRDAYDPKHAYYPLVLFKKYAFKQRTEEGKPTLNLAHALAALNKLDCGVDENVLLTSEDSKTRLVISYKSLKEMFKTAFDKLHKA